MDTHGLNFEKDDLIMLPLGGVGEIGMNMTLYHHKGKWIVIDFGAGFADENLPGVDMLVPDISFLETIKEDIVAIIITHAHEDHCGAIPHLIQDLGFTDKETNLHRYPTMYASKFTKSFILTKLTEFSLQDQIEITEIHKDSSLVLGDDNEFVITFANMTHSVPEMLATFIATERGTIMHTGDWKLDDDPVVGEVTEIGKIKEAGERGILAMVCDSTNVMTPGRSGSEGELYPSILDVIKGTKGLAVASLFASNVARVATIARAAKEAGRNVVMLGRSLLRIKNVSQENGYFTDIETIPEYEIVEHNRDKLLVICTGCQGEEMAAMNKLANQSHRYCSLEKGDTVIFSSKIIPGNEKRIFSLFNRLTLLGVEIITEDTHNVHVSGHPCRDEVREMYSMVKPRIAIPVHGEHMHIQNHAEFSKECGVPMSIVSKDGDVIRITEDGVEKVDEVPVDCYCIDGKILQPSHGDVMRARSRIQKDGMCGVTVVIDRDSGTLLSPPVLVTPGLLDRHDGDQFAIVNGLKKAIEEYMHSVANQNTSRGINDRDIIGSAKKIIKRLVKNSIGKSPYIDIQIIRVRL